MTNDIEVKVNVGKNLLQIAEGYKTPAICLWEYVRNSLGYRKKGDGTYITVDINNKEKEVVISDNSGGMNTEQLKSFFTVAGENLARKGKQDAWLTKGGQKGTGKTAAFGIGDVLIVETIQSGRLNKYKLTREMLTNASDDIPLKPEALIENQETSKPNGTTIYIQKLNLEIKANDIIRKIEREIQPLSAFDVKILVNNTLCQMKELELEKEYIFKSEGAIRDRYGEFDLKVQISKVPLNEDYRGIKIMTDKTIVGIEDCGIGSKDYGSYITGSVDIPELENPIDNIAAFSQSRDQIINKNHKGVRELFLFMAPKLEKIRKELVDSKEEQRNTTQSKKLSEITNDLSKNLNKQWNDIKRQVNEVRIGSTNSKNVDSIYFEIGDDEELEALVKGTEIKATLNQGDLEGNSGSSESKSSNTILNKDDDGKEIADKAPGRLSKRKNAGFVVDHEKLGKDEHRSIYIKEELRIVINIEHPCVKACLESCFGDVENITFKRLIFEIAFRQFEHAVALEMLDSNDSYPPDDLLYEMRDLHDKLARSLGQDIYKI